MGTEPVPVPSASTPPVGGAAVVRQWCVTRTEHCVGQCALLLLSLRNRVFTCCCVGCAQQRSASGKKSGVAFKFRGTLLVGRTHTQPTRRCCHHATGRGVLPPSFSDFGFHSDILRINEKRRETRMSLERSNFHVGEKHHNLEFHTRDSTGLEHACNEWSRAANGRLAGR